uniref:Aminoacyl tRNA synthase complex interacting n=2 Tax=Echinococcus granulosus TaxID=6210 RepID=A0A068WXM4_ECHGR|nr:aminoacyl tRNA synthase complex interacting [Echinococcus granulosus]
MAAAVWCSADLVHTLMKMTSEQLVASVRDKIELLTNSDENAIEHAEQVYAKSNIHLKREIGALKKKLINLEIIAGYLQFFLPLPSDNPVGNSKSSIPDTSVRQCDEPDKKLSPPVAKPVPPTKGGKKGGDLPVDVSRIDMRVGKIVEVERHPDADSLYVEKVDMGEGKLRTVISGLVPHVPIEKMRGLMGIFMCNLKPVKMRGIESQGMLMCATDVNDRVEPLVIENPTELTLGDRVYVQGYPGEPDAQLHPKKKVWEQVKPDMRVDGAHLATYKGVPWKLKNSPNAVIKAPTMLDAEIS